MKQSALLRIVLFAAVVAFLYPCAWVDESLPREERQSFFDQSVVGDALFKDFYPASPAPLRFEPNPPRVPQDALFADWLAFFKSAYRVTVGMEEMREALGGYDAYVRYAKTQDESAKEYLFFMAAVNPVLAAYESRRMESWNPITQKEMTEYIEQFSGFHQLSLAVLAKEKSDFFALRYGFQAVRFAVLAGKFDDAILAYDTHVAKRRGASLIGYQALGYKARALYKKNDRTAALALYLDIFDQCPALMPTALQSISLICTKKEFDGYRAKQKSDHKKTTAAFVWAFLQKRDYARETLEAVLAAGAQQTKPEIVLVRMIQTIESEFWKEDRHRFTGNAGAKNTYDSLIDLCDKTATRKDIRRPALWSAAAAYLSLLAGKTANAGKYLAQAASQKPTPALAEQIHCIGTLIELQKNRKTVAPEVDARLAADFAWAVRMKTTSNPFIADSLATLAAQRYLSAGDIPRAILAFAATADTTAAYLIDCAATDRDLETLEGILAGKNSTPFTKALCAAGNITPDEIVCARGMNHLRAENYAAAVAQFERLSPGFVTSHTVRISLDPPPVKNNATYIPSEQKYAAACRVREITLPDLARLFLDLAETSAGALKKRRVPSVQIPADANYALGNLWFSLFLNPSIAAYASRASQAEIGKTYGTLALTAVPYHDPSLHARFPLGLGAATDTLKRSYDQFVLGVNNFCKADKYYQRAMNAKDREIAARACLSSAIARGVYLSYESPKDAWQKQQTEPLSVFNKKFKETQFYKETIAECPLIGQYR